MKHHPHRDAGRLVRNLGCIGAALVLACLVPAAAGCARTVMEGRAASMLYDPDRVGGLRGHPRPEWRAPRRPRPARRRRGYGRRRQRSACSVGSQRHSRLLDSHLPAVFSGPIHACLDHQVLRLDESVKRARLRQDRHLRATPMRRTAVATTPYRGIAALLSRTRASTSEMSRWPGCWRTNSATLCRPEPTPSTC